jgi:hypothetical protein
MPIRKMDRMRTLFAVWLPEPLTVATWMLKSFTIRDRDERIESALSSARTTWSRASVADFSTTAIATALLCAAHYRPIVGVNAIYIAGRVPGAGAGADVF